MKLVFIVAALVLLSSVEGMHVLMREGSGRCFTMDDVPPHTLVSAQWHSEVDSSTPIATGLLSRKPVKQDDNAPIRLKVDVEDSERRVVVARESDEGEFIFTTVTPGDYEVCFGLIRGGRGQAIRNVRLDFSIIVGDTEAEGDDWAKSEHLDDLNTKVRRLQTSLNQIKREQKYQRDREKTFRALSEVTNTRAVIASISQVGIVFSVGVWQIYNLRRFFKEKKIV